MTPRRINWDTVQQLLRIILYALATSLAQRGIITDDMVETLIGSILAIAGVLWWALWEKKRPKPDPAPKLPKITPPLFKKSK